MSDLTPEKLAEMLTRTRAHLATFGDSTCTKSVMHHSHRKPCNKPAVALRDSREFDIYYPVCARHTRGFCIPVMDAADMLALLAAAAERDALVAAVERVRALHVAIWRYCNECDSLWPCATLRALDESEANK